MATRALLLATLTATASAFAPAQVQSQRATSVVLQADAGPEMSKSIPFLVCPEKLDGTMAGDMGFDPMNLSDIQTDLNYAREAELKHGRISMLAIVGMIVQESGIHWPGEQFTNTDPFGAVASVGFAGNFQVFLAIAGIEFANLNRTYGDGEPGDLGWDFKGLLKNMSDEEVMERKTSEIVHCRLAMIAITGATVQTLLYHKPLLEIF